MNKGLAMDQTSEASRDLGSRVRDFLTGCKVGSAVKVREHEGTVVLEGTVASFYHRQLCLSCRTRVQGVLQIVDKLQVCWPARIAS